MSTGIQNGYREAQKGTRLLFLKTVGGRGDGDAGTESQQKGFLAGKGPAIVHRQFQGQTE